MQNKSEQTSAATDRSPPPLSPVRSGGSPPPSRNPSMEHGFVPCMSPPPLPAEECGGWVLLDNTAYISAAAVSNATTAAAAMSNGAPIHVTFFLARPPRLSHLCVHYPGPALGAAVGTIVGPARGTPAVRCVRDSPLVVATHADVALLRVSIPGSLCVGNPSTFDYFVYAAASSSLELIPKPAVSPRGIHEKGFRDQDVAIVRCSGERSRYVIAVLRNTLSSAVEFTLEIFDSDTHRWRWKLLTVEAPARDDVLPIPGSATELLFHNTTKVITLDSATVAWVDLWRGILFCDVLDEKPVLRDMPLPKPARCNRGSFCQGSAYGHRDIVVVKLAEQQQVKIKYVEMGTRTSRRRQQVDHSDSDDDDDDVDEYWTATIWSMPVPIASWKDWQHMDCTIDEANTVIHDPRLREMLLAALPRQTTIDDPEDAASVALNGLITGYPTLGLGMNGDLVIYLLTKADYMAREGWVIAVGTMDNKLQGIAKLDDRRNHTFRRYYRPTEICKYLTKATDG